MFQRVVSYFIVNGKNKSASKSVKKKVSSFSLRCRASVLAFRASGTAASGSAFVGFCSGGRGGDGATKSSRALEEKLEFREDRIDPVEDPGVPLPPPLWLQSWAGPIGALVSFGSKQPGPGSTCTLVKQAGIGAWLHE